MSPSEAKNQKLHLRLFQCLPWIANPFTKHTHSPTPESQSLMSPHPEKHTDDLESQTPQEKLDEAEEIEEATPIELFYDLFFVANLTTVTSVHYITERTTLYSYILYFIILWFTWLHVTLLDVRFSVDSVYERVCKALHFGAMAAFASVSTNWNPISPGTPETVSAMRTMTLTLMFSRVVLAGQYSVVAWFGRKKAVVPLLVQAGAMAVAAGIYLGLYFTFTGEGGQSYIAWYAVALFEVMAVVATSSVWRSVCFLKTHLVERMGLLTLIILGEGIIVMLKAINTVVKGFGWKGNTFGVVVSALALIYFYWMFYFDMSPRKTHFGRFRQQIWTLLHFPFHLALVLSVEGLRQLTTVYNYQLMSNNMMNNFIGPSAPTDSSELLSQFNQTFQMFYDDTYAKTVLKDWPQITNWTAELRDLFAGNSTFYDAKTEAIIRNQTAGMSPDTVESYINNSYVKIVKSKLVMKAAECLPEFYGFKLPYRKSAGIDDKYRDFRGLFDLVFKYFFVSLGVVFILYAVFTFMARRRMDLFDWVAVALRVVPAAVFFGMATLSSSHSLYDYQHGAWPIPQIAVLVFIVLIVDKVINWLAVRRSR